MYHGPDNGPVYGLSNRERQANALRFQLLGYRTALKGDSANSSDNLAFVSYDHPVAITKFPITLIDWAPRMECSRCSGKHTA